MGVGSQFEDRSGRAGRTWRAGRRGVLQAEVSGRGVMLERICSIGGGSGVTVFRPGRGVCPLLLLLVLMGVLELLLLMLLLSLLWWPRLSGLEPGRRWHWSRSPRRASVAVLSPNAVSAVSGLLVAAVLVLVGGIARSSAASSVLDRVVLVVVVQHRCGRWERVAGQRSRRRHRNGENITGQTPNFIVIPSGARSGRRPKTPNEVARMQALAPRWSPLALAGGVLLGFSAGVGALGAWIRAWDPGRRPIQRLISGRMPGTRQGTGRIPRLPSLQVQRRAAKNKSKTCNPLTTLRAQMRMAAIVKKPAGDPLLSRIGVQRVPAQSVDALAAG